MNENDKVDGERLPQRFLPGSVAVHDVLGKVEIYSVHGDICEIRFPWEDSYAHYRVSVARLRVQDFTY